MPKIFDTIRAGVKATQFRFPTYQGGSPYSGGGFGGYLSGLVGNGLRLPAADFDYIGQAGPKHMNAAVSAILSFLMRTFPEPRLQVVRAISSTGKDKPIPDHPALMVLECGNPEFDLKSLLQKFIIEYTAEGNEYWLLIKSNGGQILKVEPVPHGMMWPYPDPTGLKLIGGYAYRHDGLTDYYKTEDVCHFRFGRDPNNMRLGFPPLRAACRDICTDNELSTMIASVAREMGIVPWLISPKSNLPDDDLSPEAETFIEGRINNRQRDRRAKSFVSSRAVDVQKLALNPQELMAMDARDGAGTRIHANLGIDPMVTGYPSINKTYSNVVEAMRGAFDNNILPTWEVFCATLTAAFQACGMLAENERFAPDTSLVKALAEDQKEIADIATLLFKGGVFLWKEARQKAGAIVDEADPRNDKTWMEMQPAKSGSGDANDPNAEDPAVTPKKTIKAAEAASSGDSDSDETWITVNGRHINLADPPPGFTGSNVIDAKEHPDKATRSEIAKASAYTVGAEIQRYAEETNEPILAKAVGGVSLRDNEPVDVMVVKGGIVEHGVEMKTMVSNKSGQISMKKEAVARKQAWVKEHKAPFHTVVFDDQKVFNADGKGKHDETKRTIYYRRGFGAFSVSAMHKVPDMANLSELMNTADEALPAAAKPPKTYVPPPARE